MFHAFIISGFAGKSKGDRLKTNFALSSPRMHGRQTVLRYQRGATPTACLYGLKGNRDQPRNFRVRFLPVFVGAVRVVRGKFFPLCTMRYLRISSKGERLKTKFAEFAANSGKFQCFQGEVV
ncbi:MAG: hypothetical protein LBT33_07515 [Spirochaetia bacterium]|jgi:hypothetical protein|nr:hypothetical protein [Spirochaetia bacterium]